MPAIFTDCMAKGMPIMVMQRRTALAKCSMANSQPNSKIQMIFQNKLKKRLEKTRFFPKGKRPKEPILKHCSPKGIPITVMQSKNPTIYQAMAAQSPEQKNQIIFPSTFIFTP